MNVLDTHPRGKRRGELRPLVDMHVNNASRAQDKLQRLRKSVSEDEMFRSFEIARLDVPPVVSLTKCIIWYALVPSRPHENGTKSSKMFMVRGSSGNKAKVQTSTLYGESRRSHRPGGAGVHCFNAAEKTRQNIHMCPPGKPIGICHWSSSTYLNLSNRTHFLIEVRRSGLTVCSCRSQHTSLGGFSHRCMYVLCSVNVYVRA